MAPDLPIPPHSPSGEGMCHAYPYPLKLTRTRTPYTGKAARKGGLKVCEARRKTSRAAYSQVRAWPPLVAISVLVLAPGTAALPQPYRIPRRYSSCDAARSPAADGGDCTRCVLAVYPTYILAVSSHGHDAGRLTRPSAARRPHLLTAP